MKRQDKPPLTEEQAAVRDAVVEANLCIAMSLAKSYSWAKLWDGKWCPQADRERADLFQAGAVGLMRAAERFARGEFPAVDLYKQLGNYARAAVYDEAFSSRKAVRFPTHVFRSMNRPGMDNHDVAEVDDDELLDLVSASGVRPNHCLNVAQGLRTKSRLDGACPIQPPFRVPRGAA